MLLGGASLADLISERILKPLNMTETALLLDTEVAGDMPAPYATSYISGDCRLDLDAEAGVDVGRGRLFLGEVEVAYEVLAWR